MWHYDWLYGYITSHILVLDMGIPWPTPMGKMTLISKWQSLEDYVQTSVWHYGWLHLPVLKVTVKRLPN